MPILELHNLDFAYGDQPVLQNIDLRIDHGVTLGLIGPNAGGKTTLMRLMLGLLRPDRGEIRVSGMSPRQAAGRGDVIGYLPQKAQFPDNLPLSVRQAVRLGLAGKTGMLRSPAKGDLDFVDALMARMGLAEVAEQPVSELSGGQVQRAFIARALAPRPKILLLDEPTTGIDRSGQQKFIEQLLSLKKELGLTVVFCSHDLRVVSSICDRVACLNVTLHYHDVPDRIPQQLAEEMFGGVWEGLTLRPLDGAQGGPHVHGPGCCPA